MTPKEQEIAIGELEERVDRLRNIYEQYFLGFEKLEPTVPRKDVDRRFAILRKEQIRNTAMRFRFQVVTQKFNTYAMHWVRICRQIEEGTYKRHIRKAKARFGDGARAAERDVPIDIDIDVDMDEFDSIDMDAVLAQADAGVASYERGAPDTVPPPASTRQVPAALAASAAPSGRERAAPDRAARGAALPPGAKPLLIRKRDEGEPSPSPSQRAMPVAPPGSQRSVPAAPPGSQRSVPAELAAAPAPVVVPPRSPVQGAPHSAPKLRPMNPATSVRGPAPSSVGLEAGAASSPRLPASSSPGIDVPGVRPAGPRIMRSPQAGAPPSGAAAAPGAATPPGSAGRMPIGSGPSAGAPAAGRIPVAAPAPGTSAPRIPAAPPAPSAPNLQAGRPAPPPAGSAGRIVVPSPGGAAPAPSPGRIAPPPAASSAGRIGPPPPPLPGGAPSAGRVGAAPPPPSVPNLPPTSLPRPVPRAPMPSVSDKEAPASDPRTRVPLPLPSQIVRPTNPTKKE